MYTDDLFLQVEEIPDMHVPKIFMMFFTWEERKNFCWKI